MELVRPFIKVRKSGPLVDKRSRSLIWGTVLEDVRSAGCERVGKLSGSLVGPLVGTLVLVENCSVKVSGARGFTSREIVGTLIRSIRQGN
jgi:hypothetical protein